MIKNLENYTSKLLIALFISFSYIYAVTTAMGFKFPASKILMLIFLMLLFCSAAFLNKLSAKITGALAAIAAAAAVYYFIRNAGIFKEVYKTIYTFWIWTIEYLNFVQPLNPKYENWFVYILCACITAAVFFFTVKKFNFYILLISGCSIFVVQRMFDFIVDIMPFYIYLFFIVLCYFYHIYKGYSGSNKNNYIEPASFIFWSVPLCALILALAFFTPSSNKPIEWKWLDTRINEAYNFFYKTITYRSNEYFSIKASGFGEQNSLGGKVYLDSTLALTVKTPSRVYLKGASKDYYTGFSWVLSSINQSEIRNPDGPFGTGMDSFEMNEGIKLLSNDPDFTKKYYNKGSVEITFRNIRTKSLFFPIKASQIKRRDNLRTFEDICGNISAQRILSKNYSYTVDTSFVKYADAGFADAMRRSRKGLYEDLLALYGDLSGNPDDMRRMNNRRMVISPENLRVLSDYARSVYDTYLQLPETLPPRVKELATSITAQYRNNYDKVSAIEKYLSQNFPYALDPASLPRGKDFVDFFLFDEKKGYCSYYASAMAVMARSIGLPARYVEGYLLPPDKNSNQEYEVTNRQAHAWAEVYFEGFGWLPFEPTAPFTTNFYDSSRTLSPSEGDSPIDPAYDEYMRYMEDYYNHLNNPSDLKPLPGNAGEDISLSLIILILFIVAAVVLLALIAINSFRRKYRLYRMSKLPAGKSVLAAYKYFVKVLSLQKLPIKPGETVSQYSHRVDVYMLFNRLTFKLITDIFIKARYSNLEITEEEKKIVTGFTPELLYESRKNLGKFRFFVLTRILGLI